MQLLLTAKTESPSTVNTALLYATATGATFQTTFIFVFLERNIVIHYVDLDISESVIA
jgi:hypothetical protein